MVQLRWSRVPVEGGCARRGKCTVFDSDVRARADLDVRSGL